MSAKQSQLFSIVWSPNNSDRFLKLFQKQIELYEIKTNENEENPVINTQYSKVFTHSETDPMKCVAWQVTKFFEVTQNSVDLIAVGLMSGVIKIISLGDTSFDSEEYFLVDKELKPKGIRQTIFVEWNPWQRSMLAQGIDKSKGSWGIEPSLLIWEIQKDSFNRVSGTSSQHSNQQNSTINFNINSNAQSKVNTELAIELPILDYCRNEVVNSFAWINQTKFICGINNKALKVFETTGIQCMKVVLTDAVYGLCLNLCQQNILASFNDDKIVIWKEDFIEKPVLTYKEDNFVELIEWSPLRDGYLCVVFKDKPFIKVLDVKIALINISQELEHLIIDRILKSSDESNIISATWHKKIENCIFLYLGDDRFEVVYLKNRRIAPWSIQQRLVVNMNSYLSIIYFKKDMSSLSDLSANNIEQFSNDNKNHSNEMVDSIDASQEYLKQYQYNFLDNDINFMMKDRALLGYGLRSQTKDFPYSSMFKDNVELKAFWKWIENATTNTYIFDSYASKSKVSTFCGVIDCIRDIVKFSSNSGNFVNMFHLNNIVSVAEEVKWDNIYDVLPFPKYTHEFRDKIFIVCGWPFHRKNSDWRSHLENIENKERAAAIALLTLNFDLALQYLKRITNDKGIDNEMLRLCLAGFNTQCGQSSNTYWSSICRDMLLRLGNSRPYLKLIFNFLIVNNKHDLQFIKTSNILLLDKLAIAALYMDDENFVDFLNYIANTRLKSGDLEAVVVTGLRSSEFIDLLIAYCDRTFDVQTAAIAVLQANILTKNALGKSKVSSQWIENYRHYLDNWNLWFIRADFDIVNQYLNFSSYVEVPIKLQKQQSYTMQLSKTSNNALKSPSVQNEVYVSCNYCYGKISQSSKYLNSPHSTGSVSKSRPDGSGFGNTTISSLSMHAGGCKATICQNCRKPLPRCSVCLMNMGSICDSNKDQNMNLPIFSAKNDQLSSNPIWSWFIWCQKCKHGGHSGHLQNWFLEWNECPVSGCKCFCSSLDSSFSLFNEYFQKTEQFNSE